MRNTTKVAIALAALAVVILVPEAAVHSTQSTAAQSQSMDSQTYPVGYQNYPAATSGCNDASTRMIGFDPNTGVACDLASP